MPLADLINDVKRRLHIATKREPDDSEDPDAPFAMVTAPLKPRTPLRHSSIAVQPEQ